ncbi:hypothetical protein [Novosphingobium acidiphilum]|uniref:hypothetical protein n=1 Tax=Novosphingobium acidiphilum TaxID=505248 RepID=UPI0004184DEF|nr:hypothetical protein [Novosphingobium acidiphilum]
MTAARVVGDTAHAAAAIPSDRRWKSAKIDAFQMDDMAMPDLRDRLRGTGFEASVNAKAATMRSCATVRG